MIDPPVVAGKKFEPLLDVQNHNTHASRNCVSDGSYRASTPKSCVHANSSDSQRIILGQSNVEPPLSGSKVGCRTTSELNTHATRSDNAVVSHHALGEDFYTKRRRLQSHGCRYEPVGRPPDG